MRASAPIEPGPLQIETGVDESRLRELLSAHQPWSHRIDFSGGVTTADFERRRLFVENTLGKLALAARHLPGLQGPILDIGCNSGFNSLRLAKEGVEVVGIDVLDRHVAAAKMLASVAGLKVEFLKADAEAFMRPSAFQVVLHFGTLYHLPNPVRALEVTRANLVDGGFLALETQVYDHPGMPELSCFIRGRNYDPTNFWALSTGTLTILLEYAGFEAVTEIFRVPVELGGDHMSRVIFMARAATSASSTAFRPPFP